MSESEARVFSLSEANAKVSLLAECTAQVVRQLEAIRQLHKLDAEAPLPESVLKDVEQALRDWSEDVSELGALPKGYFTVDFQSYDPEVLYCWTYGEDRITHTHKVWENFSNRRPINSEPEMPTDHLRWVN